MAAPARNAPCPCGSGRPYKRCCADLLEHPERTAKQYDAVGTRIQTWAFQHHREAMHDGLTEIVAGRKDVVLGDVDLALISTWILNDRQLPGGGTPAQRYAAREDLSAQERDIARRIAAARFGLLRVLRVMRGRWIELQDLAHGGKLVRVMSHDVSRSARPGAAADPVFLGSPRRQRDALHPLPRELTSDRAGQFRGSLLDLGPALREVAQHPSGDAVDLEQPPPGSTP
jgi:SEC-C motif-containing protein